MWCNGYILQSYRCILQRNRYLSLISTIFILLHIVNLFNFAADAAEWILFVVGWVHITAGQLHAVVEWLIVYFNLTFLFFIFIQLLTIFI